MHADDVIRIYKEVVLGMEPTDKSTEAAEMRSRIEDEVASLRKQGGTFDIPHEVPG